MSFQKCGEDLLCPIESGFNSLSEHFLKSWAGKILFHDCPFCGSTENLEFKTTYSAFWKKLIFVECETCEVQGPKHLSYQLALKWWNGDFKK